MDTKEANKAELQVPPDKDAMALVEAIIGQANIAAAGEELLQIVTKGGAEAGSYALSTRLGTIHGTAERLKVLLAERDAAVKAAVALAEHYIPTDDLEAYVAAKYPKDKEAPHG